MYLSFAELLRLSELSPSHTAPSCAKLPIIILKAKNVQCLLFLSDARFFCDLNLVENLSLPAHPLLIRDFLPNVHFWGLHLGLERDFQILALLGFLSALNLVQNS